MLFSEPAFLFVFLPVVLAGLVVLREGLRNVWLLGMSLVFYVAGEPRWGWVLLGSMGLNYTLGRVLGVVERGGWRRALLAAGVVGNVALLAGFKVWQAVATGAGGAADAGGVSGLGGAGGVGSGVLPLGISFFTFHAISYLVDVYRGVAQPVRRADAFGLYMMVFPQLVAGPIVRYGQMAGQLVGRVMTAELFAEGVRRFVVGLGKKVLIADTLGVRADQVFAQPAGTLDAATAWVGLVCYALQVYFDFSGYSDMAIGLGKMLGFRFPENFNYPYVARSVGDFWRRWHMTLMAWFRDYVYVPLGGSRVGPWRTYGNVMLVFVLSALWHQVSWMFLVRAGYFATLLVGERELARRVTWRPPRWAGHVYLLAVVLAGWVVFRARDWEQAWGMYCSLAGFGAAAGTGTWTAASLLTADVVIAMVAGVIGCGPWVRRAGAWLLEREVESRAWGVGRYAGEVVVFGGVMVMSVMTCVAAGRVPFLYFRF